MNAHKWGLVALVLVSGVSLGGCKPNPEEAPKVSETEQLRRYNEQRFNDLQASVTQLSDQIEKTSTTSSMSSPTSDAQILDIGGPIAIEPAPSKRSILSSLGDEVPTRRNRSKGRGASSSKVVVASGVSVREVQRALARAGFNPGKADGVAGPQTVRAIKQFQAAEGLKPDGVVGARTWSSLSKHLR